MLHFVVYADDTNVIFSHHCFPQLISTLQTELDTLNTWFQSNKLIVNIDKSNFIYFHNQSKQIPINFQNINLCMNNIPLKQVQCTQFLGVYIDCNLNWNMHINTLCKRLSRSVGILNRLRNIVPTKILFTLYNTLFLSHVNYCNAVWGNTYQTKLQPILTLQKRAIRICTNSSFRAHSKPLFLSLNCLNIYQLNKFNILVFLYKFKMNLLPDAFQNMFILNNIIHNHNTRNKKKYHRWKIDKVFMLHTLRHTGPLFWNSLPESIINSTTLSAFRNKLKRYLLIEYN